MLVGLTALAGAHVHRGALGVADAAGAAPWMLWLWSVEGGRSDSAAAVGRVNGRGGIAREILCSQGRGMTLVIPKSVLRYHGHREDLDYLATHGHHEIPDKSILPECMAVCMASGLFSLGQPDALEESVQ